MSRKVPGIVKRVRKFKPEEIKWVFEKVVSTSQLSLWNECPEKWTLRYRDKKDPFKDNIYTIFGNAIHSAIQKFLHIMYEETIKAANEFKIFKFFKEEFLKEYREGYEKNKGHFSTPEELREFYNDGEKILEEFKKQRAKFFSKRGWHLIGCEIPIQVRPNSKNHNIIFTGYIDVLMYHEPTGTFEIIDIKTSTRGWGKYQKADDDLKNQLVLYKEFFSQMYGVPNKNINVKFMILKRKIYEESEYPQSRLQTYIPVTGPTKTNQALRGLNKFINEAFNKGEFKEGKAKRNPSQWNCRFCPFATDEELCGLGKQFL